MMAGYLAQIEDGIVTRVIACDSVEWAETSLGGTWVEAPDPYTEGYAEAPEVYPGEGMGCADNLPERFAPCWVQPTGSTDAYPDGVVVWHGGRLWRSTTPDNVWEPGVSGWHDAPDEGVPNWVQPSGSHDAYNIGDKVRHAGKIWESLVDANVWEPAEGDLWTEVQP